MNQRRIAITGMGAVSAFGLGAHTLWQGLRAGTSAIAPLRHPEAARLRVRVAAQVPTDYDPAALFDERTLPMLDRATQFALLAAREAVAQSGLAFNRDGLERHTAVVVGSGIGGETSHDEQDRRLYAENATRVHPLSIVRTMMNASASQISMAHGLRGPAFVVASACASSNHAIAQSAQLIRCGAADVAVTGGTDACFGYGVLRAWEAMRVLADDTCRPFSANRRGLVLGEGAGMFVLESMDRARARGAEVLAEFGGAGMSADAGDIVAPDPEGAAAAMRAALADAGLDPTGIGYVNAHGTATQANDVAETRAIRRVFGAHADVLAVSSTKSMHGHAMGASGALELVATIQALREGVLPPTANYEQPDPACDLDYVPNVARERTVQASMSNSFAFGGLNAVLVLRRAS